MKKIDPSSKIGGMITVPGDKSIAHRAVLLSILAKEKVTIKNFPKNEDCLSSLEAIKVLGVDIKDETNLLELYPPDKIEISSDTIIDCGNSGTTVRLLSGIIAGSDVEVTLAGDESLSQRPMKRIIDPLTEMGAEFYCDEFKLPMKIKGKKLLPFEYRMPIASAQVKSAILLAGLSYGCTVIVREDEITRDHTELMIKELGEGINIRNIKPIPIQDPIDPRKKRMKMPEDFKKEITITSQAKYIGGIVDIPGDISTAAYFFAAAAISKGEVTVHNVGLNPTRTAFLEYLRKVGCKVAINNKVTISGELRGDVTVVGADLKSRKISGETTVGLIDEIPIIAVIASFAKGTTVIRNAEELKVKETDRLQAISDNLKILGVKHGLLDDGIAIEGGKDYSGSDFKSFGDHRIAMAFSIASLFLIGPSTIDDESCVNVSCPNFYDLLDKIRK